MATTKLSTLKGLERDIKKSLIKVITVSVKAEPVDLFTYSALLTSRHHLEMALKRVQELKAGTLLAPPPE